VQAMRAADSDFESTGGFLPLGKPAY
jgi:hypothetical protein